MAQVETNIFINRPLDEVFDYWADGRLQNRWSVLGNGDARLLTPEPIGLGSRFRGTFERLGTVEWSIVEYERPRRLTIRAHSEVGDFQHGILCVPTEGGTRITQRCVAAFNGRWRLLGPALRIFLKLQFRRNDRALKLYLETKPEYLTPRAADHQLHGTSGWAARSSLPENVLSSALDRYAAPRSAHVSLRAAFEGDADLWSIERLPPGTSVLAATRGVPDEATRRPATRKTAQREVAPPPEDLLPEPAGPAAPSATATRARAPRRRQPVPDSSAG